MDYDVYVPISELAQRLPHEDTACITFSFEKEFSLSRKLVRSGIRSYERETFAAVLTALEHELLQEASTQRLDVLDVGANIGLYALAIDRAFAGYFSISAYEPFPRTAQYLQELVANNHANVNVISAAVGSQTGNTELFISAVSDHSHSLVLNEKKYSGETITVDVVSIDSEVSRLGQGPCLIKIDAEGADAEVIAGGAKTLADSRPYLVVEILNEDCAANIERLLDGLGYYHYPLTPDFHKQSPQSLYPSRSDNRNWLLTPNQLTERFFLSWKSWSRRISVARKPDNPDRAALMKPAFCSHSIRIAAHQEASIFVGSCNGLLHFWSNSTSIAGTMSFVIRSNRSEARMLAGEEEHVRASNDSNAGQCTLSIIAQRGGWLTFKNGSKQDREIFYLLMADI